ncbi:hypothetical protein PS467_10925 [Streptomyces luomodiensis]|uniref:Uncharacterized protein n=1 Tax=Streptomyces luomodiensis TaxID=3026192 RepID=A0ABY9UVC5_9ACTN|nr:hypothetical protein [Streptomyces sp. SCA4-21]WNE95805.1 hypothetical protein PS467_10925 [Streptomyces sp. SCA4-21]
MRDTLILFTQSEHYGELVARINNFPKGASGKHFQHYSYADCTFGIDDSEDVLSDYDDEGLEYITESIGTFGVRQSTLSMVFRNRKTSADDFGLSSRPDASYYDWQVGAPGFKHEVRRLQQKQRSVPCSHGSLPTDTSQPGVHRWT